MHELSLWKFIGRRLKTNEPVMLMVVAESAGSSPGRAGFKMAVAADGALCGSIGGGIMETKLVELARHELRQGASRTEPVKRQIHRREAPRDRSGMICSGEQTVVFTALDAQQLPVVRAVVRAMRNSRPIGLEVTAWGVDLLPEAAFDQPEFEQLPGGDFRYRERVGRLPRLYIIGSGHCALALTRVMRRLDFYIRVYDDRPDLPTFERNRWAHEKHLIDSYARVGEYVPHGPDVYVVVMTLGYRSDAVVIRQLLAHDVAYFGVLGSAAKMDVLLRELAEAGFPADRLSRIQTPIGLPINSRTPEEIAVSVAAEIIAVRNRSADE